MKVVLLSPRAQLGGAERTMVALARRLPEHGISCHGLLLEHGPLERELLAVGCPTDVVVAGRVRHVLKARETVRTVGAIVDSIDADVVVSCHPRGHLVGGRAASALGRPSILWQHGTPTRAPLDRLAARVPAAAVVCVSATSAAAQRRLPSTAPVRVIPPGVDLDALRAARGTGHAIRARLGWDDKIVVGIIGRLQAWKGQDTFLAAAAALADRHQDLRFAVVGGAILGTEGTYERDLHAMAAQHGIEGVVHFAGQQDDVGPWFDALDVVVHASDVEPFGRVVVEAMALGKPVVAGDSGGPTEIIEEGTSGLLTPFGDAGALADAIERLAFEPGLAQRLGAAAAGRVEAYSDHAMAASFAELLQSTVALPRTRRHR